MKPLHAWRWRRRIRAVWTKVEVARSNRRIIRGALAGATLVIRVAAVVSAARAITAQRRFEAQRRAAEAIARVNALRNEELRKRYGADAIDV